MLAKIKQAGFDVQSGQVIIQLETSTLNGFQNTVQQYTVPNVISLPDPTKQVANIEVEALTQMQVLGYSNAIADPNYTIAIGEYTSFSQNWYNSTRNSGVEIQQAQTSNIENMMMGQSSNSVLIDILQMIIDITNYLNVHTHSAGTLTAPSGGGQVTGTSGVVTNSAPDDNSIETDLTYISANQNLAITNIYQPKN